MASLYATPTDVSTEIGRDLTTAETAQVDRWIDQAERLIASRVGDIAALITAGDLAEELVGDVIVAAVVRKLRNPEGLRTVTASIDDGSLQKTIDSTQSDGALHILPDEWRLLLPDSAAFSVRPTYTESFDWVDRWPF